MTNARATRPPPTIGFLRVQGVTRVYVSCIAAGCHHGATLTLDRIGLADETPFPAIATRRRWTCESCGSRRVSVMPSWSAG